ncbi:MAG: ligase-associated DNA damage response exonuclease [Steroidobacteraceae bacterium]
MSEALVVATERGLHCPRGGFYIDPWMPVDQALITHGHGDHLRRGSERYLIAEPGVPIAAVRTGEPERLQAVPYGEQLQLGSVRVSFHPAGHVLGSAQIRIDDGTQVWVVSGDYKRAPDPTCAPFEVVPCDVFISEATFALPIYRWPHPHRVIREIYEWWQVNRERGIASVLFCYALGKAQRVLAELSAFTNETVFVHGALLPLIDAYRAAGIAMTPTTSATAAKKKEYAGTLILAPPSAAGSPWMRRFGEHSSGFCSGWMRVRGNRRRRGYDRGFVLSDHVDWPGLLRTFDETGAHRILLTHGHSEAMTRYLLEQGRNAAALATQFEGEE